MSRKILVSVIVATFFCLMVFMMVPATYAQDGPRPTPTDIGPTQPTPAPTSESGGSSRDLTGNVRGHVYIDVNGDGKCVNTGVAGEEPIAGIPIEFVSSDENYVFTHTSGKNGDYELAGAGQSNWRVTAKPGSEWFVTSENPQYGLVSKNNLSATGVDFCLSKGAIAGSANVYPVLQPLSASDVPNAGEYVLPEAGAPASADNSLLPLLLVGLSLVAFGFCLRWYEISRK